MLQYGAQKRIAELANVLDRRYKNITGTLVQSGVIQETFIVIGRAFFSTGTVLFALSACAATDMDGFDPAQIRIVTPTEATSKCIGDISTPLCAVETFLACMRRLERPLCEKVGRPNFQLSDRPEPVRYRILSVRILRTKDIPDHLRKTFWMRPGNAFVTLQYLDWHGPACGAEGCEADFFFKPTPAGWQVVSWSVQGYD